MHIDWWTLGLQTVNALVLVWLLARFLFGRSREIVAERQQTAAALMADAVKAKADALAQRQAAADEAARTAQQRGDVLSAAAAEAAKLKSLARRSRSRRRRAASRGGRRPISRKARQAAALTDADRASQLALAIAAKLLDAFAAASAHRRFHRRPGSELAKLPESTREALGNDGSAVRLIAPRALGNRLNSRPAAAAFSRVLGRDVDLRITIDPAIIAGLELRSAARDRAQQLPGRPRPAPDGTARP